MSCILAHMASYGVYFPSNFLSVDQLTRNRDHIFEEPDTTPDTDTRGPRGYLVGRRGPQQGHVSRSRVTKGLESTFFRGF